MQKPWMASGLKAMIWCGKERIGTPHLCPCSTEFLWSGIKKKTTTKLFAAWRRQRNWHRNYGNLRETALFQPTNQNSQTPTWLRDISNKIVSTGYIGMTLRISSVWRSAFHTILGRTIGVEARPSFWWHLAPTSIKITDVDGYPFLGI